MYPSMCTDVVPSRLEKIVSQIINQLGNDRIGIVAYAGMPGVAHHY
jgi:Ca-activated chloride channel family protein